MLKLSPPQILFGMSDPIPRESACQRLRRECVQSVTRVPQTKAGNATITHPSTHNDVEIDTIRCRMNDLEHNKHPLPIFSPLDQTTDMDTCTVGDYCFVAKDVEILDPAKYARMFPYSGPRWCWREVAQYMLDIGVIQWADINHTLTTTAQLKHDLFANIFTTIEETKPTSVHRVLTT